MSPETSSLEFVDIPPRYGLNYDETFVRERWATSHEAVRLEIVAQKGLAARFVRLEQKKAGLNLRTLIPLCTIDESPLCEPERWSDDDYDFLARSLNKRGGWHLAHISGLRVHESRALRDSLRRAGNSVMERLSPIRVIAHCRSFEEYEKKRSTKFSRGQRSARKKALAAGYEFRAALRMEDWIRLYLKRNLGPHDYAVSPNFHRFVGSLRDALAREGRLLEIGLWRGDNLAAAGLSFRRGNVMYFYQTSHDPSLADLRPGAILFDEMIRQSLEQGAEILTFMGNAAYQHLFTRQVLELYSLEASSRDIFGRALYHYRRFRQRRERPLGKPHPKTALPESPSASAAV